MTQTLTRETFVIMPSGYDGPPADGFSRLADLRSITPLMKRWQPGIRGASHPYRFWYALGVSPTIRAKRLLNEPRLE